MVLGWNTTPTYFIATLKTIMLGLRFLPVNKHVADIAQKHLADIAQKIDGLGLLYLIDLRMAEMA